MHDARRRLKAGCGQNCRPTGRAFRPHRRFCKELSGRCTRCSVERAFWPAMTAFERAFFGVNSKTHKALETWDAQPCGNPREKNSRILHTSADKHYRRLLEATMSISGVSSSSGPSQTGSQSSANQLRQTFEQLAGSLQSGDLAGAQQAFTSLEKLLQSSKVQPANTPQSPVQSDLAALGQALSSGDLSAAQGDFSKLQKDLRPAGQSGKSVGSSHRHGHHHRPEASDSDSSATSTATTASTTTATSQNSTGGTISLYA